MRKKHKKVKTEKCTDFFWKNIKNEQQKSNSKFIITLFFIFSNTNCWIWNRQCAVALSNQAVHVPHQARETREREIEREFTHLAWVVYCTRKTAPPHGRASLLYVEFHSRHFCRPFPTQLLDSCTEERATPALGMIEKCERKSPRMENASIQVEQFFRERFVVYTIARLFIWRCTRLSHFASRHGVRSGRVSKPFAQKKRNSPAAKALTRCLRQVLSNHLMRNWTP